MYVVLYKRNLCHHNDFKKMKFFRDVLEFYSKNMKNLDFFECYKLDERGSICKIY